jgi:hypothetical protein
MTIWKSDYFLLLQISQRIQAHAKFMRTVLEGLNSQIEEEEDIDFVM